MHFKKTKHNFFYFLSAFIIFLFAGKVYGSQIKASSYGYSSSNATTAITRALNSSYDTIIIDKQSSSWNVSPLHIKNLRNKVIIFESGVILKALTGRFNDENACLLKLENASNINILGYGATFKMNRSEYHLYDPNGQWRNNISLLNCSNVLIKGLTIDESGGDGIYVGGILQSKNIRLEDLTVTNQSRDGMSIISVDGLYVKNCLFTGAKSNILGCGINFEPNHSSQNLKNIKFENCSFYKNYFYGIQISTWNLNSLSSPIDIVFNDCKLWIMLTEIVQLPAK